MTADGFVSTGLVTVDGRVAGFVDVPEVRVTLPEVRVVEVDTVVLGLRSVVLPGLRSVVLLTAGRVADLTPELLDTVVLDLVDF